MSEEQSPRPKVIGRYKIIREIGRGGMAVVYLAHDPRFDRDVAVKVLPRILLHDPSFRGRFEREAKTIAALDHPAIVPVYDFGEYDGELYLVMRHMQGGTLRDRLDKGAMTLTECATVFNRLAPALDEAHVQGMVHRDLKPGNILFDQRDDAYLSDFGIVKLQSGGATFTGTGIIGTPAYMSPEQARGDEEIDGRSDIYALGTILYEMLTGFAPYAATTPMALALKHLTEPVPRLHDKNADLPADTEHIIAAAMAKDPDERFQTAGELAGALAIVAAGKPLPQELQHTLAAPFVIPFLSGARARAKTKISNERWLPIWMLGGGASLMLVVILFFVFRGVGGAGVGGGGASVGEDTVTASPSATVAVRMLATDMRAPTEKLEPTHTPTATDTPGPTDTPTETATPTATETNTRVPVFNALITFRECRGIDGTITFGQAAPQSIHAWHSVQYTVPPGTYSLRIEWSGHSEFNVDTKMTFRGGNQVVDFGDQC